MKTIGNFLFKYRSYTPLPFLLLMILFMNPTLTSMLAGFLLVLSGEIIRILSVSYAGSETRTTSGVGGSNLVTHGPYSVIRNPLYAGNILIYSGFGIMSNSLFPYLQLAGVLYFSLQYYAIILNEENYLRNNFKEEYRIYEAHVMRFFPFPKSLPSNARSNLKFNLKSGLISEKRSLQSCFLTLAIIFYFFISGVKIF